MDEFADAPFVPHLSADLRSVELEFNGGRISLTTEQLQVVLLWLGRLRSKMEPPVPNQPTQESSVFASDFRFVATPPDKIGHLEVRTPEFGWVLVPLSPERRKHLAAAALGVAETVPPNARIN